VPDDAKVLAADVIGPPEDEDEGAIAFSRPVPLAKALRYEGQLVLESSKILGRPGQAQGLALARGIGGIGGGLHPFAQRLGRWRHEPAIKQGWLHDASVPERSWAKRFEPIVVRAGKGYLARSAGAFE
jgi:hypothetical protein